MPAANIRRRKFRTEAVIFDMDGVLVDSMPYHFISWYEALRPYGIRVSCFEVFRREGERWDKSVKDFLRMGGVKPTDRLTREIFLARSRIFRKYFKRFIFPSAGKVVAELKRGGYRVGLVTGTPHRSVLKILPEDLLVLFDCMVTGDRVQQGKPHPEPYLKAAGILNVNPRACLVVENAPYGIESAKSAGMFCVAVTTSLPPEYLKRADIVIDDLQELRGYLGAGR